MLVKLFRINNIQPVGLEMLLAAFQTGDAMFVNFGYVQEPGHSFHDFANAFVAFFVCRSIFRICLPAFRIYLPAFEDQEFNALCECFVAFRQTFQSFV